MSPPYSDCLSTEKFLESPAGRSPIPPKYCVYASTSVPSESDKQSVPWIDPIACPLWFFNSPTYLDGFPWTSTRETNSSRPSASRFRLFVVASAKELKAWLNPYRTAAAVRATTIAQPQEGNSGMSRVSSFLSTNGCHNRDRPMWHPFAIARWRSPVDGVVLALAAGTDSANPSQSHQPSAYHQVIDRATIATWCFAHGFEQEETEKTEWLRPKNLR